VWPGFPEQCRLGHQWKPGTVLITWRPCECETAAAARGGHIEVTCNEPGCSERWQRPLHEPLGILGHHRPAANAGRLLVPTRSLPASVDIPRAPRGRVDQVLLAYRNAGTASTCVTAAVADIAVAVGARSQVLTSARAAAQAGSSGVLASRGQPVARSTAIRRLSRGEPGPVERALRDLGVTSTAALLRAAGIDQAGERLIRDNQQAAAERRRRLAPADASKSATPTGPASRLLASTDTGTVRSRLLSAPAHAHEAEAEP
jgi:hypothetical protein